MLTPEQHEVVERVREQMRASRSSWSPRMAAPRTPTLPRINPVRLAARVAARYAMLAHVTLADATRAVVEFCPRITVTRTRNAWKRAYPDVSPTGRDLAPRTTGSKSEAAAMWMAEHGASTRDAGERFGITHQAVSHAWHRLFPGQDVPRLSLAARRKSEIAERVQRGESVADVASALGVSINGAYSLARRADVSFASPVNARIEQQRHAVADLIRRGLSIMDVAVELGIGCGSVLRRAAETGVASPKGHRGRRNGRIKRAIERVRNGETVTAACRAERCATPPVYVATKEIRAARREP